MAVVNIRRIGWSIIKCLLRIGLTLFAVLAVALYFFQTLIIYHPRPYDLPVALRGQGIIPLAYQTSQGRQQSYYLPPRSEPIGRLWVCFPGNGSLGLDFYDYVTAQPGMHDAFLFIDYPGYGDCQGSASPGAIEDSAEMAFSQLAVKLNLPTTGLEKHLGVLGHSLGCATGLNFAVRHPVDRVILVAPFTSTREMARRMVGWPLCLELTHIFDNAARLGELAQRPSPPTVTIFHGDIDRTIPIAMGRSLAIKYPSMITFHAVPGAGHNDVLANCAGDLLAEMRK